MRWLRGFRRHANIPDPFIYAVAAEFLPKDRPLSAQDYREAAGKAMELANACAVTLEKRRATKR